MGFTRGCFSFLLFYFFWGGAAAAESCEKGTRHGPLSSRTRSFLFACHCTCVRVCVCLVCTVLCRMWMVRLAPVIARIPGVGVLGGRGTKGHEMTLQIQLLAFHLPLTATWRGAAPGIPPPTRHTANARPRRDNLRGGGGGRVGGERGGEAPPRKKSQETICCFDSPLIRRLSGRCLFNYGKPVKTSSAVHMCVTAEARLRGPRPAHVHVAHERGLCGGGWRGRDAFHIGRLPPKNGNPPRSETAGEETRVNIYGC